MWEILQFLLNAFLFVLIGLQLPRILDGLADDSPASCSATPRRSALVVIARAARVGARDRVRRSGRSTAARPSARGGAGWRERTVLGWAGMRGAVSLAAALALPLDFPGATGSCS